MQQEQTPQRPSTFPIFSKYFGLQPQDVIDYGGFMRKQMDDFIGAIQKRIDIENNYASSLKSLGKYLEKYIQSGTESPLSFIASAFKVENQNRGHQAAELSQAIKTQIYQICFQQSKKSSLNLKRIEKSIKKLYKDSDDLEQNFQTAQENYLKKIKETQELIINKSVLRYTTGLSQEKKIKQISKAIDTIKENKEYESIYLQSLRTYNQFASNYNKDVTGYLDQIEEQIRSQLSLQTDCMRKLIVSEISMFKNVEYDIINIFKQMQHLDTQKEVQDFTQTHKNQSKNYIIALKEGEKLSPAPGLVLKIPESKSLFHYCLNSVEEDLFKWMLNNKKDITLKNFIQQTWKELNSKQPEKQQENCNNKTQEEQLSKKSEVKQQQQKQQENQEPKEPQEIIQQTTQFGEFLKKSMARLSSLKQNSIQVEILPSQIEKVSHQIMILISELWNVQSPKNVSEKIQKLQKFFSNHHFYRLIGYLFIEQYRVMHIVTIDSVEKAKVSGRLLKCLLDESLNNKDVCIMRGILGLIFTFNWNQNKNKFLLYQNLDIYQCQVWKKPDFWEGAIFQTTYEQMAVFKIQKAETQGQTMLRQKNLIFSQLASFCHYMVMLGINSRNVRQIVGRYCRLYEMSEEQNKDLSKMISNTNKQYKEVSGILAQKLLAQKSFIQQ